METQSEPTALVQYWTRLQNQQTELLGRVVPRETPVVLLDIPVYLNVGDLMIFLGTEEWMKRQLLEIRGRWSIHNFTFPQLPSEVIILLQGGGNFGDIYLPIQAFRESVVERYPQNRIVFLPQTLRYENDQSRKAAGQRLDQHKDLHVFLRDRRSLDLGQEMLPDRCRLSPDMCTQLFPLTTSLDLELATSASEVIYLLRRDREEARDQVRPELGDGWQGDWSDLLGARAWRARALKIWHLRFGRLCPPDRFTPGWTSEARRLVKYCGYRFSLAHQIATSRLHGHLLASLLGIPNLALDNNYGKISSYFRAWCRDLPGAQLVDNRSRIPVIE